MKLNQLNKSIEVMTTAYAVGQLVSKAGGNNVNIDIDEDCDGYPIVFINSPNLVNNKDIVNIHIFNDNVSIYDEIDMKLTTIEELKKKFSYGISLTPQTNLVI